MGLDELKQEVSDKAKEQADRIIKEARDEEERIINQAEEKIAKLRNSAEEETARAVAMIEKRAQASSELEVKKMMLSGKKDITESVFKQARQNITKLKDKRREQHIKKLIENAKKELEIGKVYCNKSDAKFIKDFPTEEAKIIGGIIAESKDGSISIDYSYETLLDEVKEKNMQEIMKALFR